MSGYISLFSLTARKQRQILDLSLTQEFDLKACPFFVQENLSRVSYFKFVGDHKESLYKQKTIVVTLFFNVSLIKVQI